MAMLPPRALGARTGAALWWGACGCNTARSAQYYLECLLQRQGSWDAPKALHALHPAALNTACTWAPWAHGAPTRQMVACAVATGTCKGVNARSRAAIWALSYGLGQPAALGEPGVGPPCPAGAAAWWGAGACGQPTPATRILWGITARSRGGAGSTWQLATQHSDQ